MKNKIKSYKDKKIIVVIEKIYEAEIDEKGNLICEPEASEIKDIYCAEDNKKFFVEDFNTVDY